MKESRRSWPERRAVIHAALPPTIELRSPSAGLGLSAAPEPRGVGEHILTVYFCQLFWAGPTALDLRSSAWRAGRPLQWSPSETTVIWEPRFIESMRGVYRGFYAGDESLFEESLAPLGLEGAVELFRAHFGGDDQRAVTFDRGAFVQSFGAIFEHCKRERVTLHEDFVLLGAYLAGLYDSLADLGVSFDVRAAFHRALAHVDVS